MPGQIADLIDRRRDLLDGLVGHPEWAGTEAAHAELLKTLLQSERLQLERIHRATRAVVLDKIVKYEAVHSIRDARDLERRLAVDRRCYAFFHPALPDEPLIFTEVALTHGMSSNARTLLNPESPVVDPFTCDAAIFYSISSCHEGLRGVPLGNALIARAAHEIGRTFPGLKTFATLSPIPGFRAWLASLAPNGLGGTTSAQAAAAIGVLEQPDWSADDETSAALKRQLLPLCAYYLLRVTRDDGPADPVARFHLRNGARLERINWLSDASAAGMRRAAGLMVNYVYRCHNPRHEYDAWTTTQQVNASSQIEHLAGKAAPLFAQS
jgi:malonyl-CoA decarboxylase